MKDEIAIGVNFWIDILKQYFKNNQMAEPSVSITKFHDSLFSSLAQKYKNHWYEDNPSKGCGYRCVSYDACLDSILSASCKVAGFSESPEKLFLAAKYHILFINPGQVKVTNVVLCTSPPRILYAKGASTSASSSSTSSSTSPTLSSTSPPLSPSTSPKTSPTPRRSTSSTLRESALQYSPATQRTHNYKSMSSPYMMLEAS
eukprot:TRINITY_DN327_c0_g1_i1.p1 TRINITY_DN327_c0_g1~~TRINITY_DN327_c0_g1_i1.p1  ORF type:complete len:202 (+),score=25.97 TRINITY_DN327_c0_g1_i1:23-628(+)